MSGWIRVKELPTRYEVRREPFVPTIYKDLELAKQGRRMLSEWKLESGPAKLVTIRRHQVKRTEVTEERSERATFYDAARGLVIRCWLSTADAKWVVTPEDCACPRPENQRIPTREEAEAVARAWLDANGYRLKRAK